jgi:hypothetical protein
VTRIGRKLRLSGRLSGLSDTRFKVVLYLTALCLYVVGVWLHLPYGGGYVYTDITYVFQERICAVGPVEYGPLTGPCVFMIPYVHSFIEYPVIVSMFMYSMGRLGSLFPGDLLRDYYLLTSLVLLAPALLSLREIMKIIELRGAQRVRLFWYFVVTPSFIFMMLLNWYIIGVYFMLVGLRRYLAGGSKLWSGILFGISAASNFITAAPALGLLFATKTKKELVVFTAAAGGTYLLINAPFMLLNPGMWYQSFHYVYTWNIEDSWMGALLSDPYSPYRHIIPLLVFPVIIAGLFWMRYRKTTTDPLVFAFVAMFGYVFSTYIDPPQLNLVLLPFFVLLPVASGYREFLAFDTFNTVIIILGVSEILTPFGISYYKYFHPATNAVLPYALTYLRSVRLDSMSSIVLGVVSSNLLVWMGSVRSAWEGKFLFWNDVPGSISLSRLWRKRRARAVNPAAQPAPADWLPATNGAGAQGTQGGKRAEDKQEMQGEAEEKKAREPGV